MRTRVRSSAAMIGLVAPLLGSCAANDGAVVNVMAVNYTDKEFSYRIVDPSDPNNEAGGELVDSYSSGGIRCCYTLPRSWRPDIKVRIITTEWEPALAENSSRKLKETRKSTIVNVPKYVDGVPGDLWVVKNASQSYEIVSSNYQPDHPKWPATIRGWPVASVDYRRKLWDNKVQQDSVEARLFQDALFELDKSPKRLAEESWDAKARNAARFDPKMTAVNADWYRSAKADSEFLRQFEGASDARFISWLKNDYQRSLKMAKERLEQTKAAKP